MSILGDLEALAGSSLFDGANPNIPGGWILGRRAGSFRGVKFIIQENNFKRGRQVAMHAYPFRDDPWPEDMARSPRITSFRGYVVGNDADFQRDNLITAVEIPGPGLLVHPSLGTILVSVINFSIGDSVERGRVWFFDITVVPALDRIYPLLEADTQATLKGLFPETRAMIAKDFAVVVSNVVAAKKTVTGYVKTALAYEQMAKGVVTDATSLAHLPAQMSGNFGRFTGIRLAAGVPTYDTFALASTRVNTAKAQVMHVAGTLSGLANKI